MATSLVRLFTPPAIPWLKPRALAESLLNPGPGLRGRDFADALAGLCALEGVQAVVVFGSRARGDARSDSGLDLAVILKAPSLSPAQQLEWSTKCRQTIGPLDTGVDLVIQGAADAESLSQSRWQGMGDVASEGRVLCAVG